MRNNSAWEALGYYKKAISALDQLHEDPEQKRKKLDVLHQSISPIIVLGFPENSLLIFEQGELLSKDLGDERSLIRFNSNIGYLHGSTGNYLKAQNYIEQAFEAAERIGDIELIGQVIPDLYILYVPMGEHAKAIDIIPRVIDTFEREQKQAAFFGGLSNVYPQLFCYYGFSQAFLGNFKKAVEFCEIGLQAATKIGDSLTLGFCESIYGIVVLFKGDVNQAKPYLHNAIRHLEEMEFLHSLGYTWSFLGLAYTLAGEPDIGRKYAEKGLKIHKDHGYKYWRTIHYLVLGICHTYTGDDTRAEKYFKKGIEIDRKQFERCSEGALLIWLGRILGKKQPPEDKEAVEAILSGIEISKELSQRPDIAVGNLFLGEFYAMRGQKEKAMVYLEKSVNMFEEMGSSFWLSEAQKMLAKFKKGGSAKWQKMKLPQSSKHPSRRLSISSARFPIIRIG